MNEYEMLEGALTRYANARTDRQRAALQKSVLLWGGRLYRWTQDTDETLTKQLHWLDTQIGVPSYEKRFAEWESLLRQYERACDLLIVAHAADLDFKDRAA